MTARPAFVISLDFELMWGVRDHETVDSYGANILGARAAIPRILDLFERHGIRATWATVGFVFCESKDELLASAPSLRPSYEHSRLSNYSYFQELGDSEKTEPYYFGASLIDRVMACPGQEIGSHSLSHYYCMEAGQQLAEFDADIETAVALAKRRNIALKSFVFPRNQYLQEHLGVLKRHGFRVFRGNERAWVYNATKGMDQTKLRRGLRLLDHYVNLTGHHVHGETAQEPLIELPASRFLRPYSRKLASLDGLRLRRITEAIDQAAISGRIFHLWWHPHNFGANTEENLAMLKLILAHFSMQRDRYGMTSASMGDFS